MAAPRVRPARSSALLGVVTRAVPVDDDSRLVSDDPAIVAARQRGDIARSRDELGPVVHADREPAAHVVLEVRRVAAVGASDRLDVVRPAPPGLENVSADLAAADVEDLRAAVGEFTDLVGILEALVLGLLARICGCHLGLLRSVGLSCRRACAGAPAPSSPDRAIFVSARAY